MSQEVSGQFVAAGAHSQVMTRKTKQTLVPPGAMDEPVPAEEVGYARVSTTDQDPDFQLSLLRKRGIPENNLFVDVGSGSKMNRKQLGYALRLMAGRPGWTLVVWKLDRLGRNVKGLVDLMEEFQREGWNLVSLTEQIDTRTPFGKFYLHMLACLAQLERDMTVERTKAGLARRKELGVRLGRRSRLKPAQFADIERRLLETSEPIASIARRYKVSAPLVNHHFPGWRSKTKKERAAWRKEHPLPNE